MNKKLLNTIAVGSTVTFAAIAGGTYAAENPFSASQLKSGYQQLAQADTKAEEAKCGEGKCGAEERTEGKNPEGKCGEGKCGGEKSKKTDKASEGKCGEGKCGGAS